MKVAFLLLPEFSHFGIAAATEPLFVANWLSQRTVFDWKVVSVAPNIFFRYPAASSPARPLV